MTVGRVRVPFRPPLRRRQHYLLFCHSGWVFGRIEKEG